MTARDDTRWAEHALERLSDAGYRRGDARQSVVELLAKKRCAVSAEEIDAELRRRGRRVGRASVYRVLEQLTELRLVQRLEVGQGTGRYETVHPSGQHHHHMVCERCGRVLPFDDPELERTIERLSRRVRFAVAEHEVVLHGSCQRCRS